MAALRSASATAPGPRRISFARINEPLEVPSLLALQTDSFDWLLGNERWQARIDADKQSGIKFSDVLSNFMNVYRKNPKDKGKEADVEPDKKG